MSNHSEPIIAQPCIAIRNVFGDDAVRLADFAHSAGFQGLEWSVSPDKNDNGLIRQAGFLRNFEVRYHLRWPGIEFAYADIRSETAMSLYRWKLELIAAAGGKYVTIHLGLGKIDSNELDSVKALTNLSKLVETGNELGVAVCLENLAGGWTSDPIFFKDILNQSGAGAVFDVGHAHVCQMNNPGADIYQQYTVPNREKFLGAHVYHTEIPEVGHLAPDSAFQMHNRLSLLSSLPNCKWWVIELSKPEDIFRTLRICQDFLKTNAESPQYIVAS